MFETGVVWASKYQSVPEQEGKYRDVFDFVVYCVFTLESPHRGNSNEYTKYTIFNKKGKTPQIIPNLQLWYFFPKGLKKEFKTAMVNKPSVFEPLKFYCTWVWWIFAAFANVFLTFKAPDMKIFEFANSADPDKMAQLEPPHLDLHFEFSI